MSIGRVLQWLFFGILYGLIPVGFLHGLSSQMLYSLQKAATVSWWKDFLPVSGWLNFFCVFNVLIASWQLATCVFADRSWRNAATVVQVPGNLMLSDFMIVLFDQEYNTVVIWPFSCDLWSLLVLVLVVSLILCGKNTNDPYTVKNWTDCFGALREGITNWNIGLRNQYEMTGNTMKKNMTFQEQPNMENHHRKV